MSIYEALRQTGVLDHKWQLPLGADGGRDNIAKDTAVALALENTADRAAWTDSVYRFATSCEIEEGLYMREPGNITPNSVDNLIGWYVLSDLRHFAPPYPNPDESRGIQMRAHTHNFTYSVAHPSISFSLCNPWSWKAANDWYGRFVGFKAFVLGDVYPFTDLALLWTVSVWWTCRTPASNTSDKILLWLMWQVLPRIGWVYRYWQKKMTKTYGDVSGLFAIYYGKSHIFTQASIGRKF